MIGLRLLGGIVCLVFGVFITARQIKIIRTGKVDQLGFDYKLLAGGIVFIMAGFSLLFS
jgi:4-hydroxybenzoate polyprenyltransferase